MSSKKWADKVHELNIRKFRERKVYSSFMDKFLGTDLGDMQLIRKFNKGIRFY